MLQPLVLLSAAAEPVTLTSLLPDGEPPTEFLVWAYGSVETSKGVFLFDDQAAVSVMAGYQDQGNELAFDYEHQAVVGEGPAPAAAWFNLELREGGLWAVNIRWTPRAAEFLRNKEYRYFSPAFTVAEDGRITHLINIALTNTPATKRLAPLVAAKAGRDRQEEKPMKALLKLLGLAEDATEAQAIEALSALMTNNQAMVALTGKTNPAEAIGIIQAYKTAAGQVATLSARVVELEGKEQKAAVKALVDQGQKDGKIPPALVATLTAMGEKDIASLTAYLEVAPVVAPLGGPKEPGNDQAPVTLTAEEKVVCAQMGIKPEDFAKHKQAQTA